MSRAASARISLDEDTPLELVIARAAMLPTAPEPDEDSADLAGLTEGEREEERTRRMEVSRARANYSQWQRKFLSLLPMYAGVISIACRVAGVSTTTVEVYRKKCPVFSADIDKARADAVDVVEAALIVSATVGDKKPLLAAGEIVGYERRKSVPAALAVLGSERPAKYGTKPADTTVNLSLPSPESVRDAMRRLAGIETPPVETVQTIEDKPVAAIETGQ